MGTQMNINMRKEKEGKIKKEEKIKEKKAN